jgi:hypothetical protein
MNRRAFLKTIAAVPLAGVLSKPAVPGLSFHPNAVMLHGLQRVVDPQTGIALRFTRPVRAWSYGPLSRVPR